MTDCNGATIGVGDVVEVVNPAFAPDARDEGVIVGFDEEWNEEWILAERRVSGRIEWSGRYLPRSLRLVRRKENDNG